MPPLERDVGRAAARSQHRAQGVNRLVAIDRSPALKQETAHVARHCRGHRTRAARRCPLPVGPRATHVRFHAVHRGAPGRVRAQLRQGCRDRRRLRPRRAPARAALADAGCSVVLLRPRRGGRRPGARRQDAVLRSRRRRAARARSSPTAGSRRATTRRRSREAEHVVVVVGTPVDEHLNPDPRFVLRAIEEMLDHLATGSSSSCAAPCTRASPRWSSGCSRAGGHGDRRLVLPGAHRRGQGAGRAARAPADRLGPHRARGRAGRGAVPAPDRRRSSTSTSRRPSSRSSSRTRGATSSSRRRTSST